MGLFVGAGEVVGMFMFSQAKQYEMLCGERGAENFGLRTTCTFQSNDLDYIQMSRSISDI